MRLISKYSLTFILGVLSWVLLLLLNIAQSILGITKQFVLELPAVATSAIFFFFLVANIAFVDQLIRRQERWDVIDLLWKVVVIGVSGLGVILLFQLMEAYALDRQIIILVRPISASVRLYAFTLFGLSGLFVFRKFIFYQKTRRKLITWRIFEGLVLVSLLLLFDREQLVLVDGVIEKEPSFGGYIRYGLVPVFILLSLVLSANVNWSAYLNFGQKLKSLMLIFFILLLFGAYYYTFPFALFNIDITRGFFDLMTKEYTALGVIFYFPLTYTVISSLVVIFNLPTSSVFELRSSEIASFQQINQSIQSNLDLNEILKTLLDASLLTSNSTAGWIEVPEEGTKPEDFSLKICKNVEQGEISTLDFPQELLLKAIETRQPQYLKNLSQGSRLGKRNSRFKSLLAIPIVSRDHLVGILYLGSTLSGAYEEGTILSLAGFADQAAIAVENAELMRSSLEVERYRAQLKIAREVQEQILPKALPSTEKVEFFAVAQDAEEIGGDYYDILRTETGIYKIALGDVSGKGTEAAFYMAETKGIFQALAHMELGVREFISYANRALVDCFSAGNFLTLVYLHLDTDKQEIEMIRAGHNPPILYDSKKGKAEKIKSDEDKSPGLGFIRGKRFDDLLSESYRINYQPGDLLILYTDGIVEAKNSEREDFGDQRLIDFVEENAGQGAEKIARDLLSEVVTFTGGRIDDDYTILVIRLL